MKEFEVKEWIGKGGFGSVFRVKNKLDDQEYAVKVIPLPERYPTVLSCTSAHGHLLFVPEFMEGGCLPR